ncbi:MAG: nucleotidyl transferase AbiEii/AbiGii toxin family protein [Nanoarchaeales archaeon]|nr:nucleotidyl transferase AbiEii/AbiGii toxin family protein [Nanoarchaeales archaeon]
MVYVRTIRVNNNRYYELVKCERDEDGNLRQQHLEYLGKNLPNLDNFQNVDKYLVKEEKQISQFIHTLHKGQGKLLDLKKLEKICKINGIKKNTLDLFIHKFLDEKIIISIEPKQKVKSHLSEDIHKKITEVAKTHKYKNNELEKVTRLYYTLKDVSQIPIIKEKVLFFGGTAINSIYKNYPRLSVDIDLQYVGEFDREKMLGDREVIKYEIRSYLIQKKYEFEENDRYGIHQFMIKYITNSGMVDYIKLEVNFLDRTPILPTIQGEVKSPLRDDFFMVQTFQKEELFAKKMLALIDRQEARDIYDMANIGKIDENKFRKCVLCASLLRYKSIEPIKNKKLEYMSDKKFNDRLLPLIKVSEIISKDDLFSNANSILKKLKSNINKTEEKFSQNFNKDNPEFEKFFEEIKYNPNINKSPVLQLKASEDLY